MQIPRLAALALGLLLAAAPLSPARGDDATPGSGGIRWIEGWETGKKAAAKTGGVMLVYVHRTSPT